MRSSQNISADQWDSSICVDRPSRAVFTSAVLFSLVSNGACWSRRPKVVLWWWFLGHISFKTKWNHCREGRKLSPTGSQLHPRHGTASTSVRAPATCESDHTLDHLSTFQDSIMYQHRNSLHAEVLHDPFLQQVSQKSHSSSGFVPCSQGINVNDLQLLNMPVLRPNPLRLTLKLMFAGWGAAEEAGARDKSLTCLP